MNDKLEKCCQRLKDQMATAETCLAHAGQHLVDATETRLDTMESRLKEAFAKREAKREQAASAGQRVRQLLEQTKAEIV